MNNIKENLVYFISLKYAPGLKKEFSLIARNYESKKWKIKYILDEKYYWMLSNEQNILTFFTGNKNSKYYQEVISWFFSKRSKLKKMIRKNPPSLLYFYNTHPFNILVIKLIKRVQPNVRIAHVMHEPYKPDKSSFGFIGVLKFTFVEIIHSFIAKYADVIVGPSDEAVRLFKYRYVKYKYKAIKIPLMIPDVPIVHPKENRNYVSLVGTLNKSKASDEFVELIKYFYKIKSDSFKFCIVTSSNIDRIIKRLSNEELKLVDFINVKKLSDEKISEIVSSSITIILPHKQVTQSGNIPVAFRHGTPVICRKLPGFEQDVTHLINGYTLPINFTTEELYNAITYISDNFSILSENARNIFLEKFDEKCWDNYYNKMSTMY